MVLQLRSPAVRMGAWFGVASVLVAGAAWLARPLYSTQGELITSASWRDVESAPDELTLIRRVSGWALTCPPAQLADGLARAQVLPATHRTMAESILAEAWLERAPATALAYWRDHRGQLAPHIQVIFYRKLARMDPARAEAELAQAEAGAAANYYQLAIIDVLLDQQPLAALSLARSLEATDSRWILVSLLASLARSDPEKAIAEAEQIAAEDLRRAARQSAAGVWFEASPADALRWVSAHLPASEAEPLIHSLVSKLARQDFAAAERLAAELDQPWLHRALDSALDSLPTGQLYERVMNAGWRGIPQRVLSRLIDYAAKQEPREALRFFQSVPPEHVAGEYHAKQLATAWTLIDPDSAQGWAAGLPAAKLRDEVVLRINSMLTELDPQLAMAQIAATPAGPLHARMVQNTARAFGKRDLPGALAWIGSLTPGPDQDAAVEGLAHIGAEFDPAGMVKGLAAFPASPARIKAHGDFARLWALQDVEAAIDWFATLPAGPERTATQRTIFEAASTHAPDRALELVKTITNRTEQDTLINKLALGLVEEDAESALDLANVLPRGATRARTLGSMLARLAQTQPDRAVQLVQAGDFGSDRAEVLRIFASDWGRSAPAAAAAWVGSLIADPALEAPMAYVSHAIAAEWSEREPERALAWVDTLPAGKVRHRALVALTGEMARRYPQKAFDLALGDPGVRRDAGALREVARVWLQIEPVAAEHYIRASDLSERVKQKLLEGTDAP